MKRPEQPQSRPDVMELNGLEVRCIVGMYPFERQVSQPVQVDVWIHLDTRPAAATDAIRHTLDYARLAGEIRFLLESCRFRLLETAADALCRYILSPATADRPKPQLAAAGVRLTKPEAFSRGGRPALTVWREACEVSLEAEAASFGHVDTLHTSPGCRIYRLRVAPGASIPAQLHPGREKRELVLGDRLVLNGRPVRPGMAFRWVDQPSGRYENPGSTEQSLLCVDRPAGEHRVDQDVPGEAMLRPEGIAYYPAADHTDDADS